MSLYYLILWNQVDILQKHLTKDHVHMRLWTRFYDLVRKPVEHDSGSKAYVNSQWCASLIVMNICPILLSKAVKVSPSPLPPPPPPLVYGQ